MKIRREILTICFIFFLALFLRIYKLGETPNSLHRDEVMNGYVGRFVLLNGKDLYGNAWPIFYFNRFGDYPPILPMYLSGLATFIFGVNEFAVRFPSAFLGALMILPVYLLGKLLFEDKRTGLFSALIIALLPWHIVLSRATSEGIMGLTFFSFALFLVLKGIRETNKTLIFFSLFLFLITYFLYPSFRLLTPLTLLPTVFFVNKKERKIKFLVLLSIIFFVLLTICIGSTQWGKGRFLQTSLFYSGEAASRSHAILEGLSFDEGPGNVVLARIFHNKIVWYSREFISQYLSYFSPEFLLIKGGLPLRYAIPYQGLFYFTTLLLVLLCFLPMAVGTNSAVFIYLLYLLIIAPIPASLTIDDVPNVHRAVFMVLPFILISSFGFHKIKNLTYKRLSPTLILIFLLSVEFIYFSHQYFCHTASYKSVVRNDGNKQLVLFLKEKKNDFQEIIMPVYDTLPLYYLFFINDFSSSYAGQFKEEIKIKKIGNIRFVEEWCPSRSSDLVTGVTEKTLIVENGDCPLTFNNKLTEIKLIYRKDSTKAFRLLTVSK